MPRLLILFGALMLPALRPAQATVPERFGVGARWMGMGGAGIALVDDAAAATMNPAGLSQVRQPHAGLGFSAAWSHFDDVSDLYWDTNRDGVIDSQDPPLQYDTDVDPAYGVHLFLARHLGGKFGLGFSAYFPTSRVLRLKAVDPNLPNYFMYDNRTQRYTLSLSVGGQLFKGFHIGAGIDFVPRARLDMLLTADLSVTGDGSDDLSEAIGDATIEVQSLDLDIVPGVAPVAGIQLDLGAWAPPLKGLWLAAQYRGQVGLPIDAHLDAQVNVGVTDIGDLEPFNTAALVDAELLLMDHFVPRTAAFGVAFRRDDLWGLYADLRWTQWSAMRLNVMRLESVHIDAPLIDIGDDSIRDGNEFSVDMGDVFSVRAGVELDVAQIQKSNKWRYLHFGVRGGFGYEPSPLRGQGPESSFMDPDRFLVTAGASFESWDPLALTDAPVYLDLFAQVHLLQAGQLIRETDVPIAGYPIDTGALYQGGQMWVVGAQLSFDH